MRRYNSLGSVYSVAEIVKITTLLLFMRVTGEILRGIEAAILEPMQPTPPFSLLAKVYDAIMEDIDYDAWGMFILEVIEARGWRGGAVLDLGCGTGNSTFPLHARGFDVTGLDASEAMLAVARSKLPPVTFVQSDFSSFDLNKRFGLVYSVFDALNNLLSEETFLKMARSVYRHLEPGGIFMFDVNTTVGLRELWEAGRAEGWAGDVYYHWKHSFDEASGLAKVEAYCEDDDTSFTEVHFERPYDAPELKRLLSEVGFTNTEALNYPEGQIAPPDEPRIWIVTRKPL